MGTEYLEAIYCSHFPFSFGAEAQGLLGQEAAMSTKTGELSMCWFVQPPA